MIYLYFVLILNLIFVINLVQHKENSTQQGENSQISDS